MAVHEALVERIYATFHDPSNVVADLVGQPDLRAAFAKFRAQRKFRVTRIQSAIKPVAPVVSVPNADLRSVRGRLSIKPIAGIFGMDVIEIGRLIGRNNKAALSKTPTPIRSRAASALFRHRVASSPRLRQRAIQKVAQRTQ